MKETLGVSIGATDWRSRNRTYTRENLDHTLAVSRFLIDLEIACRTRSDLSLITFEDILAASPEVTRRSRFPMSWSVPVQWHGGKTEVRLAPDGIFGCRVVRPSGKAVRAYFFLEIDRGTMTIAPSERVRESESFPYRATVLRKFYAYVDSCRLGLHQRIFRIQSPRTLFVTTGAARVERLKLAGELVLRQKNVSSPILLFATEALIVSMLLALIESDMSRTQDNGVDSSLHSPAAETNELKEPMNNLYKSTRIEGEGD